LFYVCEAIPFVTFSLAWAIKARVFPGLNDDDTPWWLAVRGAIVRVLDWIDRHVGPTSRDVATKESTRTSGE
jgi:hypothetical protein